MMRCRTLSTHESATRQQPARTRAVIYVLWYVSYDVTLTQRDGSRGGSGAAVGGLGAGFSRCGELEFRGFSDLSL